MKKALYIALYPLVWILGAFGVLAGNANGIGDSVLLAKDVANDRSYDGQVVYDQIERRNA